MKLNTFSPLAFGLAAACAATPAPKAPAPAPRAAPMAATGRPEIRYYEINDA